MALKSLTLKDVYRSDEDDLINELYIPCLSEAISYDRAVGFFSSESLALAAKGISKLIKNDGRMRLIIGHPLDLDEYEAVSNGSSTTWSTMQIQEKLIQVLDDDLEGIQSYRLSLLRWLIACGRLEIKFALRKVGMYHEKIGVVVDESSDYIVFHGSSNETMYGLAQGYNSESITIFPSWTEGLGSIAENYKSSFETLWSGRRGSTVTISLSDAEYQAVAKRLVKNADKPELDIEEIDDDFNGNSIDAFEPKIPQFLGGSPFLIRDHQKRALENWMANEFRGIFKLSTGSGKTITAIFGAIRMYEGFGKLCVTIAVPYIELAKQWTETLRLFNIQAIGCFEDSSKWTVALKNAVDNFQFGGQKFICSVVVNKTLSGPHFSKVISEVPGEYHLFIGDECHRHGSESIQEFLPKTNYRIGLSATPYSEDEELETNEVVNSRKERLTNYYGRIVSEYTLGDAIRDEVLCEYEYFIHPVRLTEDEQESYETLSSKIAQSLAFNSDFEDNEPLTKLLGERARLLGEAEGKFTKLASLLRNGCEGLGSHMLFYCPEGSSEHQGQTKRNIEAVTKILMSSNILNSEFTSRQGPSERREILRAFKAGTIKALVSMKVLDEGIDIPACNTAFILASSRNERQYVQRRGRILRRSPGKDKATIHDFVVLPAVGWEKTPASMALLRAEAKRVAEFASLAKNSNEIDVFSLVGG